MTLEGLKHEKRLMNGGMRTCVLVKCPDCGVERWKEKATFNFAVKHGTNGHCRTCDNRRKTGQGPNHPKWTGGRRVGRYIKLNYAGLNQSDKELAKPMSFTHGKGSIGVYEHRLVMAKMLGRPLERHEIVRHKNGDKHDNRPENLELGTPLDNTRDHVSLLNENKKLKSRLEDYERDDCYPDW